MKSALLKHCPIARTLDVIGEKWSILIIRDLIRRGPLRFQDLQESLTGIAPNTLSARLKSLEEQGAVARRLYAEHPPRCEYFLTKSGEALGPVLRELYKWGETHTPDPARRSR
jgi:DNA-binding HxlR family transcriptional regulator